VKPVVVLSSIALNGQTTNYTVGDTFSFTGTVTATYSNGATQTVTPTKVSTPDMTTAGDKEVTVTYTEEGVTATAKYTITVSAAAATKKYYKKVTTAPTDWSGTYLIVAGTSAANGTITSKWLKYNSVTISNNQIESTAAVDAIAVTIKKESNGNYSIRFANGDYLGTTTSNDCIKVASSVGTGFYWKFSVASSLVKIESTVQSSRILRLNSTSGFRTYTSSTGTQATLYKLQD
jgi:5-hydroxyisourate hydrolase-like protein (transthyretin family)